MAGERLAQVGILKKHRIHWKFHMRNCSEFVRSGIAGDVVLRYRAMVHGVAAPGLSARPYFNRYTEDAVDLCDVLGSYSPQAKATLHEISRLMGLPGKPDDMTGAEVEKYYRDGRVRDVAEYCVTDVVNTYRVWLRYELFRGRLTEAEYQTSVACLVGFIQRRVDAKMRPADLA
jgi:hypothetical protein